MSSERQTLGIHSMAWWLATIGAAVMVRGSWSGIGDGMGLINHVVRTGIVFGAAPGADEHLIGFAILSLGRAGCALVGLIVLAWLLAAGGQALTWTPLRCRWMRRLGVLMCIIPSLWEVMVAMIYRI